MSAQQSDAATTASQWEKVRLRLAGIAPSKGQAIISIKIVTNHGCPIVWTEPEITKIEPKTSSMVAIIAELGT